MRLVFYNKKRTGDDNMEFKILDKAYLQQAIALAKENYLLACEVYKTLRRDGLKDLEQEVEGLFECQKGIMAIKGDSLVGYLAFWTPYEVDNEGYKAAFSPLCGYGIVNGENRERLMGRLFQKCAELFLKEKVKSYEIKVYAHDQKVLTSYIFNQFGIICAEGMRNVDDPIDTKENQGIVFEEVDKEPLVRYEESMVALYRKLVLHLRKSPTFYPGNEFTDEGYKDYIRDTSTRVFIAKENEKVIGILDSSYDDSCFMTKKTQIVNVGDIYVLEEYRGKKIAQGLLQFANDQLRADGIEKLWVEHGTTNPNARGFWDKYFEVYSYNLTRELSTDIFS